jgi:hypothetical protein
MSMNSTQRRFVNGLQTVAILMACVLFASFFITTLVSAIILMLAGGVDLNR